MNERKLRSMHRKSGLVLAVFIAAQSFTGVVMSLENLLDTFWGGIVHDLHYRMGMAGSLYRLALGAGIVWMAVSGVMIWARIRARARGRAA